MVEEFNEEEFNQPMSTYEDLQSTEPERDIGDEDAEMPKSLAEMEEETGQKTDIQAILRILTPKFPSKELNDVLQPAMVSRIFADNLLDKMKLLVLRQLQINAPTDEIDLIGVISMVQDGLSIGFEGRGIVDRLEIAGASREEEVEKLSRELGF